jgi:bifunctional DNA-binding transcriptional regulator/antitoxin component of YhaV-PrlF toxin-antitoxin module
MRMSRRSAALAVLPALLVLASGCDIVTAELKTRETAEWRKTYQWSPGGRVEIRNVNGRIEVEPSAGNTVEVVALKSARAGTSEAAKEALGRIEILDSTSGSLIRVETRLPRGTGFMHMGSTEVRYTVKVPADAEIDFSTVNGGVEVRGLTGRVKAETTNGGIVGRDIGGSIEASTTNGGVEVAVTRIAEHGVKLGCTNGGITLRLPNDAKATISASITNGGITADGLALDKSESSRRRLEARLNGGGPPIRLEGTNGGIRLDGR